jgi:hypothetical protein
MYPCCDWDAKLFELQRGRNRDYGIRNDKCYGCRVNFVCQFNPGLKKVASQGTTAQRHNDWVFTQSLQRFRQNQQRNGRS